MRAWVRRGVVLGALAALAVVAWRLLRSRAGAPAAPAAPTLTVVPPPAPTPSVAPAPATAADAWVEPDAQGNCPLSHPIKGKVRTGIFHPPGAFAYDRTHADRCYRDPAAAEADGLRAAKR